MGGLLFEKFAPEQIAENERFEYRIRLTNVGSKPVRSVVLVESLLYAMSIEEAHPASNVAERHSGRWALGPLGPGQQVTVRVICLATRTMWFRSHSSVSYALES